MAKNTEASPLETGPEKQPARAKTAPEGAQKAELEQGIAKVHGIMENLEPGAMKGSPAAKEILPPAEAGGLEQIREKMRVGMDSVKGWAQGLIGKAREAFKGPMPKTLQDIHTDQLDYIENFLKNAKLSEDDRENLKEVVLMQLDANEKDPKVIAERMKLVLDDHQARMKQMDAVAKAMQQAVTPELKLDSSKTGELAGEMLKVDPETREAIAKVYGLLGTLKPDLKNPDAKAKMEFDLLTNPKVLADYLRARIPGGKAVTDIQIESLARAVALSIETQNALDRQEAAKQKEEQEKQNKLRIEKMKRVAYFINKYPKVEGPKEEDVDAFLQKMEAQEAEAQKAIETEKKTKEAAEAEKTAKMAEVGKVIIEGRLTMNLDNVLDNLNLLAANKGFDKDFVVVNRELAMGQRIIANELVAISKDSELKLGADPMSAVSNVIFRLESKLQSSGLKLPEDAKAALGTLLQHEVTKIYQEKAAKQAETIPESQKGKRQIMEYFQGERAALEKNKTDKLQSMEALMGEKLTTEQEVALSERKKEVEFMLNDPTELVGLIRKGWIERGPDNKDRLNSKGLIALSAPHWSELSPEQRGKTEALQNETMDLDKKLLDNARKLGKVEDAYRKIEDKKNTTEAQEKGIILTQKVSIKRKDGRITSGIVNGFNRDENGALRALVSFPGDKPGSYSSKNVKVDELAQWQKEVAQAPDMTAELEEEKPKAVPPPIPEAAKKKPAAAPEKAPDMEKFINEGKATIDSRKTPDGAMQGLADHFAKINASAIAKELFDTASQTRKLLKVDTAIEPTEARAILDDVKESLGDDNQALYTLLEAKMLDAVEKHNSALLVEEMPEEITQVRKKVPGIPPPGAEALKAMQQKAPEAVPESAQDKMVKQALAKLALSTAYGVGSLAGDISNLGSPADRVAADDLMKLNEELTTTMQRARGYIEGEEGDAGEDIIDEKTVEPILTGIDEVLSVYSPQLSKAAQDKVKKMVAEHNRKVEAELAKAEKPNEPPMAAAA